MIANLSTDIHTPMVLDKLQKEKEKERRDEEGGEENEIGDGKRARGRGICVEKQT